LNIQPERPSWNWGRRREDEGSPSPTAFNDRAAFWRGAAQAAIIVVAVIVFGAFLFFARRLLEPILAALIVSLTLGPLTRRVAGRRIPNWLTAIVVVTFLAGLFTLAVTSLAQPVSALMARSAEIGNVIRERLSVLDRPLTAFRELQFALSGHVETPTISVNPSNVIENVVTFVTPAALGVLLFFVSLFFFLIGRAALRRAVVGLFATREGRLRAIRVLRDIEGNLSTYLLTVTVINFGVGVITTIATHFMGLPTPILWGSLAFALNYLPYIGPASMYVILFIIGLMTFPNLLSALLPPAFYMGLSFFEGQLFTPNVVGRALLVHPLAVFLSLAFWAWLWGPVGAFLATPLLIVGTVAASHLYPAAKEKA
jgi:predicted PurR-regulated permease PerM